MINFIAKHCVKDYLNIEDPNVRRRYGVVGSTFGLVSNLFLFVMKLIVGFIFGSLSIISDALNNMADFGNSFIALFGFKLSKKPADKDHPFGHARIEYICSLIIAFVIVALGVTTLVESIHTIINTIKDFSANIMPLKEMIITISLMALAVVIKIFQSFLYYGFGKRIKSPALKAVGADSRNDSVTTTVVIIGLIISHFTNVNLDGFLGVFVSALVIFSGVMVAKDSINILLGEKPSEDLVKRFVEKIKSFEGVLGIHDLEMHCYGASVIHASVHVEVDASKDVMESHDMIDNIERILNDELHVKTVIHMDPIKVNDPLTDHYHDLIKNALKEIDETLAMHDFRIVSGPTHINLVFDVVLNHDLKVTSKEITSKLEDVVKAEDKEINLVITYDDSYTELV